MEIPKPGPNLNPKIEFVKKERNKHHNNKPKEIKQQNKPKEIKQQNKQEPMKKNPNAPLQDNEILRNLKVTLTKEEK